MKEFRLPKGWDFVSLYDLVDVIGGVSYAPEDITTSGVRIIRGGNIQGNLVELREDDVFLPEVYKNGDNTLHKGDVILVASTGSVEALGRTATVWDDMENVQIGAFLRILRPKFPKYAALISAWLSSEHYFRYIRLVAKGTSINNISLSHIKGFKIPIPTDDILLTFTAFYNAVAKKININRAIINNLEALAKQIHDYWFVQFDYPNEEGKPYKSSGGKMVWNEKLKREIPEGWSVVSVNDIADSYRGVSYTKEDLVNEKGGLLVLRGNNIQGNQLTFDRNVAYIPESFVSDDQKIRKGHIIMTMSSGSKEHVGKCVLFHHDAKETYGAFLTKFVPHQLCSNLLYNVFNSDYFKAKIKSIASGTGINNLTNQTFDSVLIAMPPVNLLKRYDTYLTLLFDEVGNLQQNTWGLTKQRDELLPLLMNGQVSINPNYKE